MNRRPIPIVLLALFQWLSIFGNIGFSAWASHLTIPHYLAVIPHQLGWFTFCFDFLALPLLTGYAVYAVKPWSYPAFLGFSVYGCYRSGLFSAAATLSHVYGTQNKLIWLATMCANLVLGAIYLMPAMRRPYFDRTLRWWESLPRFQFPLPGRMHYSWAFLETSENIRIANVSRGGAFLEVPRTLDLKAGETVALAIELPWNKPAGSFFAEGSVIYLRPGSEPGWVGVGLQFTGMSRPAAHWLRDVTRAFSLLQVPTVRERITWVEECWQAVQALPSLWRKRPASEVAASVTPIPLRPTATAKQNDRKAA